jgi:hypothetical protein
MFGNIRPPLDGAKADIRVSAATAIQRESNIAVFVRRANREKVYNCRVIHVALFCMHVLTFLFFVGLAGSSVVVVISFVEDLAELIGD